MVDLTPSVGGSEFVRTDVTAQNFEITLPQNYTCDNCTIRLLRQADEWSNGYRFWSCADIDIKSRKRTLIGNNIVDCSFGLLFSKMFVAQEKNTERRVPDMARISVCGASVIKTDMETVANSAMNVAAIRIVAFMENV